MSDNNIILNKNVAGFVPDEFKAAAAIEPGMVLEFDANGDVQPNSTEPAVNTDHQVLPLVADINEFDPNDTKTTAYADNDTAKTAWVPVGGRCDLLLASGTDLGTGSEANIALGEVLTVHTDGTLKEYTGSLVSHDPTATTSQDSTVYDPGALFVALEAVDNSGAGAGSNVFIEVVRIS